jgi:DNA-binding winged helix-turn-helix (wHTH) protein/Flp pilus assembly protein TadD
MQAQVGQTSFGPFYLDTEAPRLLRDKGDVELRPQALHALRVLVQNSGRCVDYEEMIREAWHGISVSRHTVAVTVGEVKKALHEYGSWISYHPRFGYRLDVPKSEDLIRNGWHCWQRHTLEGFEKGLAWFEEAARDHSTDFRAFEGISRCYLMLGTFSMRPPLQMYPAFLEAHAHAVSLIGLTPELRADRAQGLNMFERKFALAESELLQARRENPGEVRVHIRLAVLYAVMKRFDEALHCLSDAYHADALWPILPCAEIMIRCFRGEFDRAVVCGKKSLDLHPYLPMGRSHYAQALEFAGRLEEALVEYRRAWIMSPDMPRLRAEEGRCLALTGHKAEASAILGELQLLRENVYVDAYFVALLQDALGEQEEAMRELERAVEENSCNLFLIDVDPRMYSLRGAPGYTRLRNKVYRDVDAGVRVPTLHITPQENVIISPSTRKDSTQPHRAAS